MSNETTHLPILVGFDGSDLSLAALDWALDEAELRHLSVHVLVARGLPLASGPGALEASLWPEALAQELLQAARAHAGLRSPAVHLTTSIVVASPAACLVQGSREASTVVVGRGRHSVLGEAIAGSTSSQLAAHASCPVVVVDSVRPHRSSGSLVVGIDGSADNEAAIAYAFEAATVRNADLIAVHAWWLDVPDRVGLSWMSEENIGRVAQNHEALLGEALAGWSEKYPDVAVRRVVTRQLPVDSLIEAATEADLIVVGSRGHGGFAGLVLGSVSQGLLHRAHRCPVAVVHSAS